MVEFKELLEENKDSGGGDSEETAQGNILHVVQKRKLPI